MEEAAVWLRCASGSDPRLGETVTWRSGGGERSWGGGAQSSFTVSVPQQTWPRVEAYPLFVQGMTIITTVTSTDPVCRVLYAFFMHYRIESLAPMQSGHYLRDEKMEVSRPLLRSHNQ
jgi:hypothetical protein